MLWGIAQFERPGPRQVDTTLIVERGAGLDEIANQLKESGVIDSAFIFRIGVRLARQAESLKAGEYVFPARVNPRGAMNILTSGKTVVHRLTIPEGTSSVDVVALLEAAERLRGDITEVPPEGTLLPETYHYVYGDTRAALIARMQDAQQQELRELWAKRAPELPFGTPEEAVILASIVEKETSKSDEMPLIAGVFVNRLKRNMRLQADPTVIYALTEGSEPLARGLTLNDLKFEHPYNTYKSDGLPPGPITNPGRAALKAVLNPARSDYFYFVADGKGGHAFAATLEEHNSNVSRWRELRRQLGSE